MEARRPARRRSIKRLAPPRTAGSRVHGHCRKAPCGTTRPKNPRKPIPKYPYAEAKRYRVLVRLKPDTTDFLVRLKPDTTDFLVRLKPDTTDGRASCLHFALREFDRRRLRLPRRGARHISPV